MRPTQRLSRHSPASAASPCACSVLAAEPPVLKSGLWEVSRATSNQQPERKSLTTMCLDESVQAQMREFGMGATKEMCTQNDRKLRRQQDDHEGDLQARADDDEDHVGDDLQRQHLVSHGRHRRPTTRRC